jgi:hypothetical protein
VRSPEALDIVSPKNGPPETPPRWAWNEAAATTRGMEFGTRSVKFVGKVGNCKPPPLLAWQRQSCVCVCVCVCSSAGSHRTWSEITTLSWQTGTLRLWQNDGERSLNAHRHNTDRLTICNEIRSKYFCVRRFGIGAQSYVLGECAKLIYSHAPHNDVSVNDGLHIRRW